MFLLHMGGKHCEIWKFAAKMEIVVGTYEELILCYKLVSSEEGYKFELDFTNHSHTGCIRAIAISKRGILATGSSDEIIQLFNLKKRYEIGSLMHHKGIISSLSFHGKNHMFSTSHDGCIGVWQVGKWECLRTLRGHKGAINSLSVHPSGKMALSVSHDKTLRIWNLMTGKCAFVTTLKQAADSVLWSPGGDSYAVVTNSKADIYDVQTAKVTYTIEMVGRIQDMQFITANVVALGGEEGKVALYNIQTKSQLLEFSTDTNRVKAICWCPSSGDTANVVMVTASSDGHIKVWSVGPDPDQDAKWTYSALGQIQTKFRLTSAAMFVPAQNQTQMEIKKADIQADKEVSDTSDDASDEDEQEEMTAQVPKKKRKHEVESVSEISSKKQRKRKQKSSTEQKKHKDIPAEKSSSLKNDNKSSRPTIQKGAKQRHGKPKHDGPSEKDARVSVQLGNTKAQSKKQRLKDRKKMRKKEQKRNR